MLDRLIYWLHKQKEFYLTPGFLFVCICHTYILAILNLWLLSHFLCLFPSQLLKEQTYLPKRDPKGDLLMAVDHCFSIRGQGTVMTGTILQGSLAVNDTVEIPVLKVCSKSLAMTLVNLWITGR